MTFNIVDSARGARIASRVIAQLNSTEKDYLLGQIANAIDIDCDDIILANRKDIEAGKAKGLSLAMLDRLLLTSERILGIAKAVRDIINLKDPVGLMSDNALRPNGIQVAKMRIPLGVIAMIYEARPNVTVESAALCIKSGNAVILRGGSEAIHSNIALAKCIHQVLLANDIDPNIVTVIPDTRREVVTELLKQRKHIDVVIPRGGEGLICYVTEHSQIPVIQHFKGVCHLFVDQYADLSKAINILVNGKTQRPSACNAIETLLVHRNIAAEFLPLANKALADAASVIIHACKNSQDYFTSAQLADNQNFHTEYLAQEISVKTVDSFDEAIDHINEFSSDHTEVIVSQDISRCQQFIRAINSSVVIVNASSRFSDGGQLGLGAEIGISTSKLHAYGPMGLLALTTEKFVVIGDGQIRE
jgi:glutamate-5-semialdehyde dehydrogenase